MCYNFGEIFLTVWYVLNKLNQFDADSLTFSNWLFSCSLVAGNPRPPRFVSDSIGYRPTAYNITWTTDSYSPITEYKLFYRKSDVSWDSTLVVKVFLPFFLEISVGALFFDWRGIFNYGLDFSKKNVFSLRVWVKNCRFNNPICMEIYFFCL